MNKRISVPPLMAHVLSSAVLFVALVGCQAIVPPATPTPAISTSASPTIPGASQASPTETASPAPSALSSIDWGPLAVADDPALEVLDAGGGTGMLRIGERCVTWHGAGNFRPWTLIWRSGQTRWDPIERGIVFNDLDSGVVMLRNGTRFQIGGAMLAAPDSPDQGAAQPVWLVEPDATCPEFRWVIHQLGVPRDR